MSYTLIKLLTLGTYPTGTGANWRAQFGAASIAAPVPTITGEILYPGSSSLYGIYAAYAFESRNPFDQTICVPEASVGAPVQIYMNGVLVSEVSAPGTVVCSAVSGLNVFEAVRSQAPLNVIPAGSFIDPSGVLGRWVSLYPAGSDPFSGPALGTLTASA